MNYTKGEWSINICDETVLISTSKFDIVDVLYNDFEDPELISNAQLIAAAPDMDEALKEAYAELKFHNWHNSTAAYKILAAIEKAEGKTI